MNPIASTEKHIPVHAAQQADAAASQAVNSTYAVCTHIIIVITIIIISVIIVIIV